MFALFRREPFYELYEALEVAKCTTVGTLKQLTKDSSCLAAMTELTRVQLLEAAALMPAGKRKLVYIVIVIIRRTQLRLTWYIECFVCELSAVLRS
jgi:hypothetical protein